LVHACLEGPEAGVYYRGKGEIVNNEFTTIYLPDYVKEIASELTVQITPVYNGNPMYNLQISEVENNQFNVYGSNGKFHWFVQGKRESIEVEPFISKVVIKGNGPYKWI
jgi:hypothetical protein